MSKCENESVTGYKVFNPDWTCRGKQYSCPGEFKENVVPDTCHAGMHFCKRVVDCFNYYDFNPHNHVAEVIASGRIVEDGGKCATDTLQIVREIPWVEVIKLVNIGNWNTGNRNTGDCNTGNRNTGDCNTGNRNTGNRNTGEWNAGDCNIGNRNTGDWNVGDRNTGDWNTGSWNTGDWNTGNCNTGNRNTGSWNTGDWNSISFSNGVFCTKEPEILIFNKASGITLRQWRTSDACQLLDQIRFFPNIWVWKSNMTDEEKEQHPEYKTIGGFLKVADTSDCCIRWWNQLTEHDRDIIRSIPNFDPEIFKQITGIDA